MTSIAAKERGQKIAEIMFKAGAIHVSRQQPYILAAGWASPVYVDIRLLIGEPELRQQAVALATDWMKEALQTSAFDALVGAETAGIPFAAWIAERTGLKFRYIRKRPLGIGRNAQVEGGAIDGLNALLVDDLTTDGRSKLNFVRGLRAAGAHVEHILTIFYHDAFPDAGVRLGQAGLTLHALATWSDVLAAQDDGQLSTQDRQEIERFLSDPVAWSARHGGRSA
ncbi:MAG: hypothetical protein BGP04_21450 [Rhizobiales bacterium 62-17]|nr:orotate phosphoribosyltransferase [Hyphomicrobiales bacterium]OJY00170.1 MAG: hypothetical protein BGP04_21450 [Rhizobiales bacterium 62-17]